MRWRDPKYLPRGPGVRHSPRLHRGPGRPARGTTQHGRKIRTLCAPGGRAPPCRADACPVQRALVRAPRGKGLRIHRRVWLTVPEGQSPCLLGSPRLRPPDCAEAAWKLGIELQEVGCRPWRKAHGARHQDRASAGCTREGRCASLSGRPRLGRPTDPRGAESGQGAGGLLPGPTWEPSGGSAAQDPGAGRQSSPPSSVGDTRP